MCFRDLSVCVYVSVYVSVYVHVDDDVCGGVDIDVCVRVHVCVLVRECVVAGGIMVFPALLRSRRSSSSLGSLISASNQRTTRTRSHRWRFSTGVARNHNVSNPLAAFEQAFACMRV